MAYAQNTNVPIERTKADIEKMVAAYGATCIASAWASNGAARIEFIYNSRKLRFELRAPEQDAEEFTMKMCGAGKLVPRSKESALKFWAQACRAHWRALLLCIKAKLEAVESGITTFDIEFMPYMVLPNNKTAGEHVRPMIEQAYESGKVPMGLLTFEPSK